MSVFVSASAASVRPQRFTLQERTPCLRKCRIRYLVLALMYVAAFVWRYVVHVSCGICSVCLARGDRKARPTLYMVARPGRHPRSNGHHGRAPVAADLASSPAGDGTGLPALFGAVDGAAGREHPYSREGCDSAWDGWPRLAAPQLGNRHGAAQARAEDIVPGVSVLPSVLHRKADKEASETLGGGYLGRILWFPWQIHRGKHLQAVNTAGGPRLGGSYLNGELPEGQREPSAWPV